jgi:hypothetical protein
MMLTLIKLASSPLTWLALLAAIVLFLHQGNQSLKNDLKQQAGVIEQLEENTKQLNKNVLLVQQDQETLNTLIVKKSDLKKQQDSISARLDAIPDTSTCKPFENVNTLEAARTFRDYQHLKK